MWGFVCFRHTQYRLCWLLKHYSQGVLSTCANGAKDNGVQQRSPQACTHAITTLQYVHDSVCICAGAVPRLCS